ncbi:MAG: hypothetical protein GX967_00840 [Clostridiales bacterium]|nr:hypothetical protein [Clostridiales bacterium]
MEKGKSGITLTFIAAIAFLFAATGSTLALVLLTGFALLYEKNEWLTKQVLQALLVTIAVSVIMLLHSIVFDLLGTFGANHNLTLRQIISGGPSYESARYDGVSIILSLLSILITRVVRYGSYIFYIIGFFKVIKGFDARLPFISGIVDKAFGIVRPKPAPQQFQQYQQPGQQPQQFQNDQGVQNNQNNNTPNQ